MGKLIPSDPMRGPIDESDEYHPNLSPTRSGAGAETLAPPTGEQAQAAVEMADTPAQRGNASSIGRFLLLRKLGAGGMGEVFSGYDEQLDRKVAIKLLLAANAPKETQKRMLREAQALAKLAHPNVVAVHEVGQADGDVFVVMEHIEGVTLREWQRDASRSVEEILQAYVQAGRGLAAVHAAGMIHRDFKPHNAMMDRHGRVRILDFGLAHARGIKSSGSTNASDEPNTLAAQLTAEGALAGTPAYMSAEQFNGEPLDARTDQFSFCVALYEALYKSLPAPIHSTLKNALPGLASELAAPPQREDIPPRVTYALMRGLSHDREKRFSNMNELLTQLEIAPHADPSGQSRQRLLFGLVLLTIMGMWLLVPESYFGSQALVKVMFLPALVTTFVAFSGAYIFRNTLFRNPFHRQRIEPLLIMSVGIVASRGLGILHHDSAENVVARDMFIVVVGVALTVMLTTPRILTAWIMLVIAVAGVIALATLPQYLAEIASITMNSVFLSYLLAWHRSTKIVPSIATKPNATASIPRPKP